ncbi:MAG: glutaredoxin family protein [Gammaproteobacteria bacterium]|nr:glutaredoxin family protein [Gammaproteobacteria bacterium]
MSASGGIPEVHFYRKADCELCEELARELNEYRAAPRAPEFRLVERDVETDAAWMARYGERVPALVVGGISLSEYFFDPERFEAGLRRAAQHAAPAE